MEQSTKLKVVGLDPSLRNWGISQGTYCTKTNKIEIAKVDVIQPVISKNKQVRQNSLDIESALQLFKGTMQAVQDAQAIFVEVPVGSQSARAMASYGICVGVLGSLRAAGIPFFEVTPTEVKLASVGNPNATKQEMINWAIKTHPEAQFPVHNGSINASKAEHMADATAAIHAGINNNQFKQLISLISKP